jgi:hypothetical protein
MIVELIELAEYEYHMLRVELGLGLVGEFDPGQAHDQAMRGHRRMMEIMDRMRKIQRRVKCKACMIELAAQLQLKAQALREIERVWEIERQ